MASSDVATSMVEDLALRKDVDPREFRNALGHFATGVTVITACAPNGDLIGITANSFNSVSLDPPMVLWSLAKNSKGLALFSAAGHFCVNILADDQVELSNHFAAKKLDKFASVEFRQGQGRSPVLAGCAANFECRTAFTYEGGDHLIFVGEVLAFEHTGKPGLVYHQGHYAVSEIHPFHGTDDAGDHEASGFVDDYLDYLLSVAAHRLQQRFQSELDKTGRRQSEWRILAVLSDLGAATFEKVQVQTLMDAQPLRAVLEDLDAEGLVSNQAWGYETEYYLTDRGKGVVLNLLAAAKAQEASVLNALTPAGARDLKYSLKKLISNLS